jgi:tripartite-type tricarboxylate transporter receptor subunit TctC
MRAIVIALALLAIAPAAHAQSYPTHPIRMIVPFPPGGATDIITRIIGQKLSEQLGQSVVIDNRPGAGGAIGSEAAAKSPPDGYTLLMATTSTHSIGPTLNPKTPYNVEKDFIPVSQVALATNVLVISPVVNASSVKELIELAKKQPGKLNFASSGNGTIVHLTGELFRSTAGIDIVHVPYKGTALSIPDLLSGNVAMIFDNIVSAQPNLKAGKLKALAVTSKARSSLMPELPTVAESGLPGFESDTYFGVFAPAGTPKAIVDKLSAELRRAVTSPEVKEALARQGAEPVGSTPEQFAATIRSETDKWAKLIKQVGVKVE